MQQGYVYMQTEPVGKNFHPDFSPQLTPREILELGAFGGKYMTDCQDEFPASWFRKAKLSPDRSDPELNLFGVDASQSLEQWRRKGWIWEDDPRGWFQWYCRYYMGRRCHDDERQIKRWRGGAISARFAKTVSDTTSTAGPGSDRPCCTGRMTRTTSN
jgi:hypothetical protein